MAVPINPAAVILAWKALCIGIQIRGRLLAAPNAGAHESFYVPVNEVLASGATSFAVWTRFYATGQASPHRAAYPKASHIAR